MAVYADAPSAAAAGRTAGATAAGSAEESEEGAPTVTNLKKICRALEDGLAASGEGGEGPIGKGDKGHISVSEEETQRVLRRFSRMYMTTLAMEIDRIESELRQKL
eukprot:COSAG06_NODE_3402_length_5394_cov_12.090115_11_plen_105_part_01